MRRIAFLVNFGFASLLVPASVACLALPVLMPGNPAVAGAFLGGMFALLTFAIWAALEWRGYMRNDAGAARQAAFCSTMFGGLMLLAAVFNVLSIIERGEPIRDELWQFLLVLIPPAAWFIAVGLWQLRQHVPSQSEESRDDESLTPAWPDSPSRSQAETGSDEA